MTLDAAWALGTSTQFDVMGVPAVITRPSPLDEPITAQAIWILVGTQDEPAVTDFRRRDSVRTLAIQRSDVDTIARGTRIDAPLTQGGTSQTWLVDRVDISERDVIRVLVTPECRS